MPYSLARLIYSTLFYLASPLLLFRLWWRGRRAPGYRRNWWQRFGYVPRQPESETRPIWIHAVSVGETVAIKPLVEKLLAEQPDVPILMTSMTPTGAERAKALFGDRITHVYCPYDLPCSVSRFLSRLNPQLCLIVETELWPNLISQCQRRNIPVVVANARLSERSANGYRKVSALTRGMLSQIRLVLAQNPSDARRFVSLGLDETRVEVCGSIKFDLRPDSEQLETGAELKQRLSGRTVLTLASSHEGEEKQFLDVIKPLQQHWPELLLMLVPRHPERFDEVYTLCESHSVKVLRHSYASGLSQQDYQEVEIYLGDTMGDLMSLYAASDVVVMGGSFAPVGGHNPLEPGCLSLPVIMGPHHFNFADLTQEMVRKGAMMDVGSMEDVRAVVEKYLDRPDEFLAIGTKAREYVASKQGAVEAIYTALKSVLIRS